MKNLFYCSFALVILASCGHGSGSKDNNQVTPAATALPVVYSAPAQGTPGDNSLALNPKHGQPGHRCDIPEGAPLNTAPAAAPANPAAPQPMVSPVVAPPATNGASGVRLNPPHGQPGHDCAVEVGKPLKN